jgi:hypothetical protein
MEMVERDKIFNIDIYILTYITLKFSFITRKIKSLILLFMKEEK